CLATMFNGALAFGAFFLPGFMWRFSLVPCSGGWSWKPDSLGFHWRTAAFNLQLRLGHCRREFRGLYMGSLDLVYKRQRDATPDQLQRAVYKVCASEY
ncbi:hypothetical protein, partial [Burkholderia contaminans]|uniref:hypothetical protein n=1 Tax=Burkholderia contaminans TaxID=488447 RepID=UPI00158F54FF